MELVNANDILSDPEKRSQYDTFGGNMGNMKMRWVVNFKNIQ